MKICVRSICILFLIVSSIFLFLNLTSNVEPINSFDIEVGDELKTEDLKNDLSEINVSLKESSMSGINEDVYELLEIDSSELDAGYSIIVGSGFNQVGKLEDLIKKYNVSVSESIQNWFNYESIKTTNIYIGLFLVFLSLILTIIVFATKILTADTIDEGFM